MGVGGEGWCVGVGGEGYGYCRGKTETHWYMYICFQLLRVAQWPATRYIM